ncbi:MULTISPECIES: hypothetical protein [unclassified Paenibacillus]|uniref:hypothetical protein n=1 Tax=unclassified Paenibacillus TaxID=185978 RepID=UPI002F3ED314
MLIKFSSAALIRTAASISISVGVIYMLAIMHLTDSLTGVSSILVMLEGQNLVAKWAAYALFGGMAVLIGSLFMNSKKSVLFKRFMLGVALIAGLLLIVAQLPPLFWWILVNSSTFSWSGGLFFILHLIIMLVSLWQSLVTIYALERSIAK